MKPRPDDIMIRHGTADDVPSLCLLERESFSCPWSEDMLREDMESPYSICLMAFSKDGLLGYVCGMSLYESCDLSRLAVFEKDRRRGVASALTRAFEKEALAKGAQKVLLEVREGNLSAIALYEKLGFKKIGVRRGYYENPREDAIIMEVGLC